MNSLQSSGTQFSCAFYGCGGCCGEKTAISVLWESGQRGLVMQLTLERSLRRAPIQSASVQDCAYKLVSNTGCYIAVVNP